MKAKTWILFMTTMVTTLVMVSSTNPFMPEGEEFPEVMGNLEDFVTLNFKLFENNLKTGFSLKSYYYDLFDFVNRVQTINLEFEDEVFEMLKLFQTIVNSLIKRETNTLEAKLTELNEKVLKFNRNAKKWSVVFDTAMKWIQIRIEIFPAGKTRDKLVEIVNDLSLAKNNLFKLAYKLERMNAKINRYDPYQVWVLKDFNLLIRTLNNKIVNQFLVHTNNALTKVIDLVNKPESSVISKLMGINILKFV